MRLRQGTLWNDGAELDNGSQSGSTWTLDWRDGYQQTVTLAASLTASFTAPDDDAATLVLRVVQDGTGGRTITWPAWVKWPSGTPPTLSTGRNSEDLIVFYWNGTSYYGMSWLSFS